MSAGPAHFDSESWKLFFRNFLLLASLLLCPCPLQASDEAMVAELKKWYAEVTAQMRAGEHAGRLGVLNRMMVTAPELTILFGQDAARLIPSMERFALGWQAEVEALALHRPRADEAGVGGSADEAQQRMQSGALKFLPLPCSRHPRAVDSHPQTASVSPFVWASRLRTWVPDLARSPDRGH
jgi:hypothetical protein